MNCCHQLCTKAAVVRCKHSITWAMQQKNNNFSCFDNSGFAIFRQKPGSFSFNIWPYQYWKDQTVQRNILSVQYLYFLRLFSRKILALSPAVLTLSPGILAISRLQSGSLFSPGVLSESSVLKSCVFFVFSGFFLCFLRVSFFGKIVRFLDFFHACFSKKRVQNQGLQEMILRKRGSSRMSPGQMHTDDQANQSWTFEWFWEVQHIF